MRIRALAIAAITMQAVAARAVTTSFLATSRPMRPSARLTYSSSDALAGLSKGSGTGPGAISVRVFVAHDGATTQLTIPAGAYGGIAGWIVNDAARALFSNHAAPGAPTGVSRTSFAAGRRVRLVAKNLGDVSPLALDEAPSNALRVAYVVTNGAETVRHCAQFVPGSCVYTPLDAGTGWRLRCRDGVADPSCGAAPACGNGVRQPGEECDGGPLCTPDCRQGFSSCCEMSGQCASAPAYTLHTYLIQYCQQTFGVSFGPTPYDGLACDADGACTDEPIAPTPVCCETTATTCTDSLRSSLHDLFVARELCAEVTGLDVTKTHVNAVCGADGVCVSQ